MHSAIWSLFMKRVVSIATLFVVFLSLLSCGNRKTKARQEDVAEENGKEWFVLGMIAGDSPFDYTENGELRFSIGGVPFHVYGPRSDRGIIDLCPDRDRGADSLSFADFLSVDLALFDIFGQPVYSGSRSLFQKGYSDSRDLFYYLEKHKRDNKGIDEESLYRFFSLMPEDWQSLRFDPKDQPGMNRAVSFATDFEMNSIYEPVEDVVVLVGYHSSFNLVRVFLFGKEVQ